MFQAFNKAVYNKKLRQENGRLLTSTPAKNFIQNQINYMRNYLQNYDNKAANFQPAIVTYVQSTIGNFQYILNALQLTQTLVPWLLGIVAQLIGVGNPYGAENSALIIFIAGEYTALNKLNQGITALTQSASDTYFVTLTGLYTSLNNGV